MKSSKSMLVKGSVSRDTSVSEFDGLAIVVWTKVMKLFSFSDFTNSSGCSIWPPKDQCRSSFESQSFPSEIIPD